MTNLHRYDIDAVRAQFPALKAGSAHFDGPGGTQVPQPVIDAMVDALSDPLCNRGASTAGERNAEAIVTQARQALADFLGADPGGIVVGRSSTQLAYDFSRTLAKTWRPGDEVVVTRLDHECNVMPWVQAAADAGVTVRWADFDPETGELTPDHIREVLSERTRLVAVTAASNLIGTRPDIPEISRLVHRTGALFYVDAAQYSSHASIDFDGFGADFLTCSAYKFLGPHLGVLAARPELLRSLKPDKLLASTDTVPERFELGILPYGVLSGARATIDFWAGLGPLREGSRRERLVSALTAVEAYEDALRLRVEQGLAGLEGVTVHSRASSRTPTLLLTIDGHHPQDVYRYLAGRGVDTGAGTFYSVDASHRLGLGDQGGVRVGLAPYSSEEDVDRLLEGIADCLHLRSRSTRRFAGSPVNAS
ncbi:cysteine desulfurase-like protein [Streptomyces sp. V1I1]|uniref:cysteine desulfurase-like protein n=1 Tax=Streptomyces sp. V1I1 TaxID=3042272 RepID=UPI00278A3309|nr:cysteine desulfurase-like protein [Streptomyces sp. V1I1]MDQ0940769.1 cysteine desulfurase family protein (TIGR01976 family) [Streptomyces sp. V1I1]